MDAPHAEEELMVDGGWARREMKDPSGNCKMAGAGNEAKAKFSLSVGHVSRHQIPKVLVFWSSPWTLPCNNLEGRSIDFKLELISEL